MKPVHHIIKDNTFWLSAQRTLYWEQQKALIVSDLHFGKTGHFRKNGIAVPQNLFKEDLQRLVDQISFHKPEQLIVVGDMFHSKENKELDLFTKWRNDLSQVHFHLVQGNHDILTKQFYGSVNIDVTKELTIDNFSFIHDIADAGESSNYFFSGHIHPGVRINGVGKQSLCLPCFYFGDTYAVLPAFSKFTGVAVIKAGKKDSVYAILGEAKSCRKIQ